jgi:hypothetical protein
VVERHDDAFESLAVLLEKRQAELVHWADSEFSGQMKFKG